MSGMPAAVRKGILARTWASDFLPLALVAFCMVMNFALALLNSLVASVQEIHVVVLQLFMTLCAAGLLVLRRPRVTTDQAMLFIMLAICVFASTVYHRSTDLKTLYDMSVIPLFVVLGSTIRKIPRWFVHALFVAVLATTLVEALAPDLYARVVNPLKYYANTRSWVADKLEDDSGDPGFYFGAERDGGIHRASGLFLEPLSTGYFACIAAIFYIYEYKYQFAKKMLALAGCVLIIILADARASLGVLFVIAAGAPILARLPRLVGLLLPFLVFAGGAVVYYSAVGSHHIVDMATRLSWTYEELRAADLSALLFGGLDQTHANDSAILYFADVAGILGYILLMYISAGVASTGERPFITNAALIYLASTSLFGHAFASIKTGALLGFLVASHKPPDNGSAVTLRRDGGGASSVLPNRQAPSQTGIIDRER
ncbi:hypothetical protein C7U60_02350 [Mesorhizobium plurifarium]|uniref:hypothetical protein n=1 Tax=Sinorhizobium arboris TaxID=76745 RepID=UPI000484C3BB|nr:hypothetical protein [Sinorhizobium arboris]PST27148.1 hypothetical protein C7U60_02350 [Mesorhizobium plurifarium]